MDQVVNGHPLAYLDNAASTQKPRAGIDAISHFLEHENANVHRGLHELSTRATAVYEGARERLAQFLNAPSVENMVFRRGVTESINLVANSWGRSHVKSGDTILLTEMEHHSNLVPWQMLAESTGARIVFCPVVGDESRLYIDAFRAHLEKRCRKHERHP